MPHKIAVGGTAHNRAFRRLPLPDERWLALSPDGHYRSNHPKIERDIRYVVQTDDGVQHTLTPEEFATKHGWKNDPEKLRLLDR